MKSCFIITVLFMVLSFAKAQGQTFTVISFNEEPESIHLLPLNKHNTLLIACQKDTLHINNVNYIQSAKLVDQRFLKIVCDVSAGVGMDWMQTLVLSVNNHRLCPSLNVTSRFRVEFLDFSKPIKTFVKTTVKTRYSLKLHLTRNNSQNYKLRANIYGESKNIKEPESNYSYNHIATLYFDTTRHIFYSSHEHVAGNFSLYDPKIGKDIKKHVESTCPVVRLGRYFYYYIQDEWYERPYSDILSKYYYR